MNEQTALGILAFVSVFAAAGMFLLQDADTSIEGQAAAYQFFTSGDAQSIPPNHVFNIRNPMPIQCSDAFDCPEGYDCQVTKVDVKYFNTVQTEYQKRCVALEP